MLVQQEEDLLGKIAKELKSIPTTVLEKLQAFMDGHKTLLQELKMLRKEKVRLLITECIKKKEEVASISLITAIVDVDPKEFNEFANNLIQKLGSGVVALGLDSGEKCQLLVAVSSDLKDLHAGKIIKEIAPLIQGGGGGKPNMAQAGGKDPSGLPKALEKVRELIGAYAT